MKVLLLDRDESYTQKAVHFLGKNPEIQLSVCNDPDICRRMVQEEHFQVILFDSEFELLDPEEFRKKNTAFGYISSEREIINDLPTIYKYDSTSLITEQIMQIYSEHTHHELKQDDDESDAVRTRVISFFPVNGGSGSSSMAMAAAIALSREPDKNVLYLTLEQRHAEMLLFSSAEVKSLTDIVSMLRTNYPVKEGKKLFQTVIQHDQRFSPGKLDYIQGWQNITDCLSLTPAVLNTILEILRKQFSYHYIIIDADFIVSDVLRALIAGSDKIVFVSSGADTANAKVDGIHRYLEIVERDIETMPKKYMIFNQYYGLKSEESVVRDMQVIGRFARYRTDQHNLLSTEGLITQILLQENGNPFRELM
ncbi:MAG TPA: hypothetical protein DCP68_04190 [Ruminococcus sp.]|nr:hypothetical protein [Ruminococcus sp.]